jgi:hypothetical protein
MLSSYTAHMRRAGVGRGRERAGRAAAAHRREHPPPAVCACALPRRTQHARVKSSGSAWVHERTLAARRVLTQSLHRRGVGRRGVSEAAGGVSRAHCACAGRARAPRAARSTVCCACALQSRPRGVAAARGRSRPARGGVGAARVREFQTLLQLRRRRAAAGLATSVGARTRNPCRRGRAGVRGVPGSGAGCVVGARCGRGRCRRNPLGDFGRRDRLVSTRMLTPPCSRPAPRRRRCAAGVCRKHQGATMPASAPWTRILCVRRPKCHSPGPT